MTDAPKKKTHEEYMATARILGDHLKAELSSLDPMMAYANVAIHFLLTGSKCPLCLDRMVEKSGGRDERPEVR